MWSRLKGMWGIEEKKWAISIFLPKTKGLAVDTLLPPQSVAEPLLCSRIVTHNCTQTNQDKPLRFRLQVRDAFFLKLPYFAGSVDNLSASGPRDSHS